MPDGQTQQASSPPPVSPPVPDHLSDLRIRPAPEETTWQTIKRNVTPEFDTSRTGLGPGHEFDSDTPQTEGEQQYKENFGSPLERAYGHAKNFLAQHEQHLSDRVLRPFRAGLDNMAADLQRAGESGHTKSGGQLNTATRALAVGTSGLLRLVPVGKDLRETATMALAPPELGPEGKALSKEIKAARAVEKVHEPVGIHEDDVPRGSKTPDVSWEAQDLQDRAKKVTPETVAQDYGPKRKGAKFSVYKSHIPMEDLPTAKIVGEEELAAAFRQDWRDDYQGILRRTTPPIKVRVLPKGELQILDGNHRAKLWEEADMSHAPAWVIDERGKGIENLSEDEKAERAAEEEERQAPAKKELPPQPRLPDTGTHAAIKTDDGSIYFDNAPDKQRTHITLAKDLGIPPERVVSGGWLNDGHYEASERSDAGRWGEQARAQAAVAEKRSARGKSLYTPEGAQPLADKLGARVVGSVATGKTSPDPYGINRGPKDLDLRIEGDYNKNEITSKMKAAGFEPSGSSLVSPEEAKKSGQPYGKSGWKRIEHFENAAGHKVDIFHDEPGAKARERELNLKHVGIGLTEMNPADAKNWVGYEGQKTFKVYRGVDDPSHTIQAGDYVSTSKEAAQNYGKHVQELTVSPSDLRYVRGHKNGDSKLLDIGGQTELIYAPKKTPKTAQDEIRAKAAAKLGKQ